MRTPKRPAPVHHRTSRARRRHRCADATPNIAAHQLVLNPHLRRNCANAHPTCGNTVVDAPQCCGNAVPLTPLNCGTHVPAMHPNCDNTVRRLARLAGGTGALDILRLPSGVAGCEVVCPCARTLSRCLRALKRMSPSAASWSCANMAAVRRWISPKQLAFASPSR